MRHGARVRKYLTTANSSELDQCVIFGEVMQFYNSDINRSRLQIQLTILKQAHDSDSNLHNVKEIWNFLKTRNGTEKEYFSEIIKVLNLILLMPATNAQSERVFSVLRRMKPWLRSTMGQERVNWCTLLSVCCEKRTNYL